MLQSLMAAALVSGVPTVVMLAVATRKTITPHRLDLMTAFAGGALMADACHHLHGCSNSHIVASIALFFFIDLMIHDDENSSTGNGGVLAIIGDATHNFTDGLAIASAIRNHRPYGTIVAITMHEIPHQLADFAVLCKSGLLWRQIFVVQLMTSLACYVGVIVGNIGGGLVQAEQVEGFTAGAFLYLALSSMLPSVRKGEGKWGLFGCFLVGIAIIHYL